MLAEVRCESAAGVGTPPFAEEIDLNMSDPFTHANQVSLPRSSLSFREALLFWLKLGFISFGGPAGQIAIMHSELVERRRWISDRRFLHALNYCMVLPGPEAQQLATYIGWLLHGTRGGIVAGGLFVLPSLFILMALSAIYVAFGNVPSVAAVLDGIKPAVVAIVVVAVIRVGSRAIRNGVLLGFAVAAFVALAVFNVPFPIVVLSAGVLGWIGSRIAPEKFKTGGAHGAKKQSATGAHPPFDFVIDDDHEPPSHARPNRTTFLVRLVTGLLLWAGPMALLWNWQGWDGTFLRMGILFTTSALVTFGGAYAVLPYVARQSVQVFEWLKPAQMVDGLALGETTPGPLIMVVAFVGFVGGYQASGMGWTGAILGCLIATYFTFLPSFLFIFLGAPYIESMRGELHLTSALTGITAAVVGVILNLAVFFGKTVIWPTLSLPHSDPFSLPATATAIAASTNWFGLVLAIAAFVALQRFKVSLSYVVLVCAAAGLLRFSL